jgi:hypothetical protein
MAIDVNSCLSVSIVQKKKKLGAFSLQLERSVSDLMYSVSEAPLTFCVA